MRVLVNAANLNGAGALGVGVSLIPALLRTCPDVDFRILVPDRKQFRDLNLESSAEVKYFAFERSRNSLNRLRQLRTVVPDAARGCDQCLTLGDIGPLKMPCPQSVYLQQALFVYSPAELNGVGVWSPLKRLYLRRYFKKLCTQIENLFVQTPVIADRVSKVYGFDRTRIEVIPPAVPSGLLQSAGSDHHPVIHACRKPHRLLFLSAYYPHKNHAILPGLVRELRSRGLAENAQIYVTLDKATVPRRLYSEIENCSDVITDLGPLSREEVARAMHSATALFLPTLLESFTLVYLEAMAKGLPIFTSDRDFSRWCCGDMATYFEPTSAASIANALPQLPQVNDSVEQRQKAAASLARFPHSWDDVANRISRTMSLTTASAQKIGK